MAALPPEPAELKLTFRKGFAFAAINGRSSTVLSQFFHGSFAVLFRFFSFSGSFRACSPAQAIPDGKCPKGMLFFAPRSIQPLLPLRPCLPSPVHPEPLVGIAADVILNN